MQEVKAVAFDLYGTLLNIGDVNAYFKLFKVLGLNSQEMKKSRHLALTKNFCCLEEYVDQIKPDANINLQIFKEIIQENVDLIRPFPEVPAVLKELDRRGLRLGIISNLASPYKQPFYKYFSKFDFDSIIFSCDVGIKKPDLSIYKMVANELDLDCKNILMVGDSLINDVVTPLKLNMQTVQIDRTCVRKGCPYNLKDICKYIDTAR